MRGWRALRPGASAALSSGSRRPPRRRAWEASLSPLERVKRLLSPPEEEGKAPRVPIEGVSSEGKGAPWVPTEAATPEAKGAPRAKGAPWVPPEVASPSALPEEMVDPWAPREVATSEAKVAPEAKGASWVPSEVATPQTPIEGATLWASPEAKVAPWVPPGAATPQARSEAKVAPQVPPEVKVAPEFPPQAPVEAVGVRPSAFRAGELALAEVRRKYNTTLKLLCRLAAGSVLASPGGLLPHCDIIGQVPGQVLATSAGARLLLRRPSLEEYVLLMPRGPTIAYPKDISALLMMMDIHPGDTVLETGSGSGALSLFLSRTGIPNENSSHAGKCWYLDPVTKVHGSIDLTDFINLLSSFGSTGRVLSYEVRNDHHNLAKKNYSHWRAAWAIGHREEWPDNVEFILKDISAASEDMKRVTFDAVVLDMLSPQCALPVVQPSLKPGGVCAVYLANITQVIDLLDRVRTCRLPFVCEKIIEVTHRNWLVVPAKTKNSKSSQRTETPKNAEEPPQTEYEEIPIQDEGVLKASERSGSLPGNAGTCGSVPYVARPALWQEAHSAFLTKLRKFQPLPS